MVAAGIRCVRLSKVYEKGVKALDSVSFSFDGNGIIAMIGRNGAGKTTLVRILSTELMPSSGKAYINGLDAVEDASAVRNQIAIVPQEARAVPWLTPTQTILSYLLYRGFGYSEAKRRTIEAMKRLDIDKYKDKLNRLLSGGTKRKVMIATVLASEARIIFLDEPTTGLDPISRNDLWKLLLGLKKDYLIFLTTHYLEEAEHLADRIGIIEEGKLLGIGTMDELRKKMKYQYSIMVLDKGKAVKPRKGITIRGIDGSMQILTTEKEAFEISRKLIIDRTKFSTNPVSLEDIFYYVVRKPITEETEGSSEDW